MRRKTCLFIIIFLLNSCGKEKKVCSLQISPYAKLKTGERFEDGIAILNGRFISPQGDQLDVGTFPLGIAISPDGEFLALTNNGVEDSYTPLPNRNYHSIYIYSTSQKNFTKIIPEPSLSGKLAFSPDGKYLYATGGGGNSLTKYSRDLQFEKIGEWSVGGFPAGIVATDESIYLTLLHEGKVAVLSADGEIQKFFEAGIYPYDITISPQGDYLYVSNLGEGNVTIINILNPSDFKTVEVGKNPEGIELSRDGRYLFVANTDSDTISVIQVPEGIVIEEISLNDSPYPGVQPADLFLSPDGRELFAVLSGDNAVAVISAENYLVKGFIPSGYYPSGVVVHPKGHEIYILNARGDKPSPNPDDTYIVGLIRGTLSVTPYPDELTLAEWSAKVQRNNNPVKLFYNIPEDCEELDVPLPLSHEIPSKKIKHVVYIVRENKTYDAYLGDFSSGNGDPELALFGKDYTPNTHALAERFALCDNFYEEVEQSVQGHIWISLGWINDYMERTWASMAAREKEAHFFLPSMEPVARPGERLLIENLFAHGVSFRLYGDILGIGRDPAGKFKEFVNWKFPTWSLHVRDVDKAEVFIEDLKKGIFPSFVYIWLPNDHTMGLYPGAPYPESMVADNDEAVGRVVEAISRSPYWKETVIFIFEDDPQSTPDHVDAHRSPLLIVSPWVKRGYVSSVHYSFPSIHKTMELLLGIKPTSRYDDLAPFIYDVFSPEPDFEPYEAIPRKIPEKICCDGKEPPHLITRSLELNFELPDLESRALGEILWEYMKGFSPPVK